MLRLLVVLSVLVLATPAAAGAGPSSDPILYVQGVGCPAHRSCTGNPAYFDRIREIPKVGLPSKQLSNGAFSDSSPAWSPNHELIAFVRESHNGLSYTIWVMNANGTGATALTHGNRVDGHPSFSPDGKTIVFSGDSPDHRTSDLYEIGTDGAGLKLVLANPDDVSAYGPDWSPAANVIVFRRSKANAGAGTGIYTIRSNGTGLKRLEIGGQQPAWSPDGRRIAFTGTSPGSQVNEVFVMSSAGTGKKALTSGAETTAPAWSPDGSQLAVLRGTQIAVIGATGNGVKQLTKPLKGAAFVDTPAW